MAENEKESQTSQQKEKETSSQSGETQKESKKKPPLEQELITHADDKLRKKK